MKFKAFTLAEVLITLGIIGIVAALTIPSIISAYRKKVTETKLKQTYSILSTALTNAEAQLGEPYHIYYNEDQCPQNTFYCHDDLLYQDFIKPYVSENVKEINTNANSSACWANINPPRNAFILFGKCATFPNGTSIVIYNATIHVITDPYSSKKISLTPGKNLFNVGPIFSQCAGAPTKYCLNNVPHVLAPFHQIDDPGLGYIYTIRYRGKFTNEQMKENCSKTSNEYATRAAYCTQMYLENNFTFPKDYPIQF